MPFEDICKLVAQRLLQGCMNHEQFVNYYDFLGLEGYKLFHEYHFYEQMFAYRKFITYFIKQYDKFIPEYDRESLNSFSIIPNNWYGYTRQDVDVNTRKSAVKSGLEKYVHWEEDTKNCLEDLCSQANQQGFVSIVLEIQKYIRSVEEEINKAKQEHLEIKATDYDLPTIVSKQQDLVEKYSKKLCQITPRKESNHVKSSRD